MKIKIYHQHLLGNDPEEFLVYAWLDALREKYESVIKSRYPDATVAVEFDLQDASGHCRGVEIIGDIDYQTRESIEGAASALYDCTGSEPWWEEEN